MTDGVRSKEGTAVYGIISATSRTGGAMAQFVAVPKTQIAPLPVNTAPSAAASLPLAGLTAHQALEAGHVKAGDRLLFTAGAGGVESLGVQLAAARGAEVVATAGPTNLEFVQLIFLDLYLVIISMALNVL